MQIADNNWAQDEEAAPWNEHNIKRELRLAWREIFIAQNHIKQNRHNAEYAGQQRFLFTEYESG